MSPVIRWLAPVRLSFRVRFVRRPPGERGNRLRSILSKFREALDAMRCRVDVVLKRRKSLETVDENDPGSDDGQIETGAPRVSVPDTRSPPATNRSRENAFRQIEQVAEAFAEHEPHSPVQLGTSANRPLGQNELSRTPP